MTGANDAPSARRKLEWFLALLAAGGVSLISLRLYSVVGSMQPMWPLPALYLLEVTTLAWVAVWVLTRPQPRSAAVVCAVAGALMGFSILGALSIGLYYLPTTLLLGIAGALATWRARRPFLVALASFGVACAAQVLLMLVVLRLATSLMIL